MNYKDVFLYMCVSLSPLKHTIYLAHFPEGNFSLQSPNDRLLIPFPNSHETLKRRQVRPRPDNIYCGRIQQMTFN